jgi:hypothetical protein
MELALPKENEEKVKRQQRIKSEIKAKLVLCQAKKKQLRTFF